MRRATFPFIVRHRDVWSIAFPATIAFITEPLAGITDLTVIGRLGDASLLGGTVLGGVAASAIFSLILFLRLGTAGLTAQAIGARDPDDGLIHLIRAMLIALVLGLALVALAKPTIALGALLLAPGTGVAEPYETYFFVRLLSVPFVGMNFALLGWFYGRAAATTGMLLQVLIHLVNIALSIWFVYGFGWGVAGVAWATAIGQIAATFAGLALVARHFGGPSKTIAMVDRTRLANLVALNRVFALSRDLMIRSVALMATFFWFTAQTSRMGEVPLAANELLLYFLMVTAFFLDGQGQAAEQLCGKAVGANYRPAFARAVLLTLGWGHLIGLSIFLVWMQFGGTLIDFMSTNQPIRDEARTYLTFAALTAFTGVAPFVLDGVVQGATLNNIIRNGMLAAAAIFLVAAIILQQLWGLAGLWIAIHIFFVSRGIIFGVGVWRQLPKLFSEGAT